MADYRKLAIQLIAADGKTDVNEIKLIKKALYVDGKITHEEVAFLIELRNAILKKAKKVSPNFDKFYLNSLHISFLGNGIISAEEVGLLQKHIVGDKTLKAATKKSFLDNLKKKATQVAEGFDKLYEGIKK